MTTPTPTRHDDVLHRFLIENSNVRGSLVHLDQSWQSIRASADYPPALAQLLGQASAATALLGGHTKIEGNLSLHLKGSESVSTIFAEYRHPGLLRGLAHWRDLVPDPLGPRQLGPNALLALTMESSMPGTDARQRYQGLIDLDADTLAEACEQYFTRSEQLPTRLLLAANATTAAGLLLQVLPGSEPDVDHWQQMNLLLDTVQSSELLEVPAETLLWRLFHQQGVRLVAEQSLRFGCTCSRIRVADVLRSLGEAEAMAAIQDEHATITCEFCGRHYHFDRIDIATLFAEPAPPSHTTRQ